MEKNVAEGIKENSIFLLSASTEVDDLVKQIKVMMQPFERMLSVSLKYLSLEKALLEGVFVELDPIKVEADISAVREEISDALLFLETELSKDNSCVKSDMIRGFNASVAEFETTYLPIVKKLRCTTLKRHHLNRLANETSIELNYGLTLRHILRNLDQSTKDKIDEIWSFAIQESEFEGTCTEMMAKLTETQFEVNEQDGMVSIESLKCVISELETELEWLEEQSAEGIISDDLRDVYNVTKSELESMIGTASKWRNIHEAEGFHALSFHKKFQTRAKEDSTTKATEDSTTKATEYCTTRDIADSITMATEDRISSPTEDSTTKTAEDSTTRATENSTTRTTVDSTTRTTEDSGKLIHLPTDGQLALLHSIRLSLKSIYKHVCLDPSIYRSLFSYNSEIISLEELFLSCYQ